MRAAAQCLALGAASLVHQAIAGSWPPSLQFLETCDNATFNLFVGTLANMTKLTYTATWGSYHKAADDSATVDGWERVAKVNPAGGGMRALAFVEPGLNTRGVIAFRGTDLNRSGVSGQADACADIFLEGRPLPQWCSVFSNSTLDYLENAFQFVHQMAETYPEVKWFFTGHSLGAALAEAVALVRGEMALSFSAPPIDPLLARRTKVNISGVPAWQAVAFYDEWDPLRWLARGNLPGSVACHWLRSSVPAGCEACDMAPGGVDLGSDACSLCFVQTHIFKNYLTLASSGLRPVCSNWTEAIGSREPVVWQ